METAITQYQKRKRIINEREKAEIKRKDWEKNYNRKYNKMIEEVMWEKNSKRKF